MSMEARAPNPHLHPVEERVLVVGVGTGRSGSKSLARLLNAQPDTEITHELGYPKAGPLPWDAHDADIHSILNRLFERPGVRIGDVSSSWLPHLQTVFSYSEARVRVVALQRPRAEVVESFLRKTGTKNHWRVHDVSSWHPDPIWDPVFPNLNQSLSKEEAIGAYWDEYHECLAKLQSERPDAIRIWPMELALGSSEGRNEILEFVGIPPPNRVEVEVHHNQSKFWWTASTMSWPRRLAGKTAKLSLRMYRGLPRLFRRSG